MIKINNFRGELSDISAKTETLSSMYSNCQSTPYLKYFRQPASLNELNRNAPFMVSIDIFEHLAICKKCEWWLHALAFGR